MPLPFRLTLSLVAILIVVAVCRCSAQPASSTLAEEFRSWDTPKLYAHGISLLKRGTQLNEAIFVLRMSVDRDRTRCDYQSALGSAYASRFASISCAARQSDSYARVHHDYEKRLTAWDLAQKDPANAEFGSASPEEPAALTTPDDSKRFVMQKDEVRPALLKLGRQSIAAYDEAHKLARTAATEERAALEYERGWGLFLLRRFGNGLVPDELSVVPASLKKEDVLELRQSEVIDCFTRCTALEPKTAGNWHSLALAHVPKTIFAIEYDTVQKYAQDLAINRPKDDSDAIATLRKALTLKPRDFNLLYHSAQIAYAVDPAFGLDCLDRAAQRMSTNALIWYFLADQRLKRASSHNERDALNMNNRAVRDVQAGNASSEYWAIPIVVPAPPLLKKAWEYVTVYGLTEDHLVLQETWSALGEFAADRDMHGDETQFMNVIRAMMTMGLKAIDSMDAQDLNVRDPRARIMRRARVFNGIECCFKAHGLVKESQKDRPDDRKAAYLEEQQDLIKKLLELEKEVTKPDSPLR